MRLKSFTAPSVTLADKVRFLASPRAQPATGAPEVVETHMSWVFLAGDDVLKLKKPVRTSFLDFSTLAAREYNCHEEVRLNRRLAPGVYLGVVPLVLDERGLSVGPEHDHGVVVDWLVHMRRLPRERMLDAALVAGTLTRPDIDRLGTRLAQFFSNAAPVPLGGTDYVERFVASQAANEAVLMRPEFREDATRAALDAFDRVRRHCEPLLVQRAVGGHVREGHGDLRPEHIALDGVPVVIDCLEFNRALREVDPFDELAFLGLECRLLGAPWIGPRLIAQCSAALRDEPDPALIGLYTAHRALLRARLAAAHLLDAEPRTPERWLPQARRYAAAATEALTEPRSAAWFR
jgi:aminoglycoside phosphotransferase family enzyme